MQEVIVFGGGCFWCTEAVFRMLRGVESVTPGYTGGNADTARYTLVSTGTTGHAEVIRVVFNPELISLEQLLAVFFVSHDPTQINRQGADVGTQYRSAIFYTKPTQKEVIERFISEAQHDISEKIVTEVAALNTFYPAELYHNNYYMEHKEVPYCQIVIGPKLEKVEKIFNALLDKQK